MRTALIVVVAVLMLVRASMLEAQVAKGEPAAPKESDPCSALQPERRVLCEQEKIRTPTPKGPSPSMRWGEKRAEQLEKKKMQDAVRGR